MLSQTVITLFQFHTFARKIAASQASNHVRLLRLIAGKKIRISFKSTFLRVYQTSGLVALRTLSKASTPPDFCLPLEKIYSSALSRGNFSLTALPHIPDSEKLIEYFSAGHPQYPMAYRSFYLLLPGKCSSAKDGLGIYPDTGATAAFQPV